MPLDTDKIDDAVLALLALTLHDDNRAWKGFDWDALDRLHAKGLIYDPVNKTKSVAFTRKGSHARLPCAIRCSRRRSPDERPVRRSSKSEGGSDIRDRTSRDSLTIADPATAHVARPILWQ